MTFPDEQIIETPKIRRHSLYQLATELVVPSPTSLPDVFRGAIDTVCDWIQERLPIPLGDDLRRCDGYTAEADFPTLFCEAIFEENLWSIRLVQTSSPFDRDVPVAERTWTTDIALRPDGEKLRCGIQVWAISNGQAVEKDIVLAKPSLIDQLATRHGIRDVRRLDGKPWILAKRNDLRRFHDLLISSDRTLPVVLLTQIDRQRHPNRLFSFTLDDLQFAKALLTKY